MKKALVLALTVLMVLSLATVAFAAEVTYEGKVELKWGGGTDEDPAFKDEKKEAKVFLDFTKDYGDGVTAGVKTKIENDAEQVAWDGEGWVKVDRDLFAIQASTGIDGGVGRDFGEANITKAPGLGLDLKLVDGLTVNTIVNGGPDYAFLVKGEYAQDLFTVGGGFQSEKDGEDSASAFGVYGTANLIEGLVLNAEYGSRKGEAGGVEVDPFTGVLLSAAYDVDALSVKGSFLMQDALFKTLNDDDADQDYRLNEFYRFNSDDILFDNYYDVMVIFADASYQLTDALAVNANFDYLLSVKDAQGKELDKAVEEDIQKMSYKVGATYTIDDLKFEGWYKAYVKSQFGGKVTYTLADGVDTSFEVTYGKENKDADGKVAYTAAIAATL